MPLFRKKPVEVIAKQLEHSGVSQQEIIHWIRGSGGYASATKLGICIDTLEGYMYANFGDWIIKGINGEFYPCKPDIFEKSYERVGG